MTALLQVSGLGRDFTDPPVTAIDDINLTIESGQRLGIVGPSGCGKSTLLRIVAGLDAPTRGSIAWQAGTRARPVALMPQHDGLYQWCRVVDNVGLAARIAGRPRAQARAEAMTLLADFGLAEFARAWPDQLSGGMRSRVAFLRTMLARPALMALDEPFGALDSLTRTRLQGWLLAAAADRGLTFLLVTHDVEEAVRLSDRVLVMSPRPGRIIADVVVQLDDRGDIDLFNQPAFQSACARVRTALAQSHDQQQEER